MVVLSHCNQFWEGKHKSIWQLTDKDRSFLSNLYNRWSHEGFTCRAFSYRPLLPEDYPVLSAGGVKSGLAVGEAMAAQQPEEEEEEEDDNDGSGGNSGEIDNSGERGESGPVNGHSLATPSTSSTTSSSLHPHVPTRVLMMSRNYTKQAFDTAGGTTRLQGGKKPNERRIKTSPAAAVTPAVTSAAKTAAAAVALSAVASASAAAAAVPGDAAAGGTLNEHVLDMSGTEKKAERSDNQHVKDVVQDQILLGMTASRKQPKEAMTSVIEDLDAAGVRFVFFSPRQFRRAQILPGQMGLETGWNSSISIQDRPGAGRGGAAAAAAAAAASSVTPALQIRVETGADAEEKKAVAGSWHHTDDWDEKAHLPHGISGRSFFFDFVSLFQ